MPKNVARRAELGPFVLPWGPMVFCHTLPRAAKLVTTDKFTSIFGPVYAGNIRNVKHVAYHERLPCPARPPHPRRTQAIEQEAVDALEPAPIVRNLSPAARLRARMENCRAKAKYLRHGEYISLREHEIQKAIWRSELNAPTIRHRPDTMEYAYYRYKHVMRRGEFWLDKNKKLRDKFQITENFLAPKSSYFHAPLQCITQRESLQVLKRQLGGCNTVSTCSDSSPCGNRVFEDLAIPLVVARSMDEEGDNIASGFLGHNDNVNIINVKSTDETQSESEIESKNESVCKASYIREECPESPIFWRIPARATATSAQSWYDDFDAFEEYVIDDDGPLRYALMCIGLDSISANRYTQCGKIVWPKSVIAADESSIIAQVLSCTVASEVGDATNTHDRCEAAPWHGESYYRLPRSISEVISYMRLRKEVDGQRNGQANKMSTWEDFFMDGMVQDLCPEWLSAPELQPDMRPQKSLASLPNLNERKLKQDSKFLSKLTKGRGHSKQRNKWSTLLQDQSRSNTIHRVCPLLSVAFSSRDTVV